MQKRANCLSVFDHFFGLAFKRVKKFGKVGEICLVCNAFKTVLVPVEHTIYTKSFSVLVYIANQIKEGVKFLRSLQK